MAEAGRKIAVICTGYAGIPAAALLADVPGHKATGIQRRSKRSGWKIEWINSGKNLFEGDEPGMGEVMARVVVDKKTFRVTDDLVYNDADTDSDCWSRCVRGARNAVCRRHLPGYRQGVEAATVHPTWSVP